VVHGLTSLMVHSLFMVTEANDASVAMKQQIYVQNLKKKAECYNEIPTYRSLETKNYRSQILR